VINLLTGGDIWVNGKERESWVHTGTDAALLGKERLCSNSDYQQEDKHKVLWRSGRSRQLFLYILGRTQLQLVIAACCYRWSSVFGISVGRYEGVSVGHVCVPCKNCWTDRHAVCEMGVQIPRGEGAIFVVVQPIQKHWEFIAFASSPHPCHMTCFCTRKCLLGVVLILMPMLVGAFPPKPSY